MSQERADEMYMRRCLQLAECGRQESRPNPMVGAVIVCEGRIIGEGYHIRCGEGHAEVNAFRSVRPEDEHLLPQSTLYVSLEPCSHHGKTPPCADLIVRKGVRRVVVGCVDSFSKVSGRGIERLREAGISVTVGVLEEECRWLNRRFFTFHEKHRPYIILKWAQTADGYIDRQGHALKISTPFTQRLVHKLRAEEDAIAVGRVTAEREQPRLDVRLWSGRSPVRWVLSRDFGWPQLRDECLRLGLQSLIVEGGRDTLQRFIDHGLWDEIRVEEALEFRVHSSEFIVHSSEFKVHSSEFGVSSPEGGGQEGAELRVESTPAPVLPSEAVAFAVEEYDGNRITHYRNTNNS